VDENVSVVNNVVISVESTQVSDDKIQDKETSSANSEFVDETQVRSDDGTQSPKNIDVAFGNIDDELIKSATSQSQADESQFQLVVNKKKKSSKQRKKSHITKHKQKRVLLLLLTTYKVTENILPNIMV
ncbi:hypothetical protein A2U01_0044069, partial [Trifolium medium]|nr:hypothetical protein [Trifolium medium]